MSEIIVSSSHALPVPSPKVELSFRLGNSGDFSFIDELQTHYNKQLGYMPTSWLEGKVKKGQILVAETRVKGEGVRRKEESDESLTPYASTLNPPAQRVGYIIAQDNYLKREELGIVYQLAVKPGLQRGYIGAALLKAQFDRSAYGCRLYCCWCAQDIDANRFWESMGFVPIAHRNGSEKKGPKGSGRVQIFWQKKIRGNQDSCNWWFPSKTDQGAMRADRIALPIMPGVHWKDVELIRIPGMEENVLEDKRPRAPRVKKPVMRTVQFGPPGMIKPVVAQSTELAVVKPAMEKQPTVPKKKIDPKYLAFARECRDRWSEEVNENGYALESAGKYDLMRQIGESTGRRVKRIAA